VGDGKEEECKEGEKCENCDNLGGAANDVKAHVIEQDHSCARHNERHPADTCAFWPVGRNLHRWMRKATSVHKTPLTC
jgi:hypothetical protein